MTTDVITVSPDTPALFVLDLMIKKHVRRLPVVDGGKIIGMVYISDLFYKIVDKLASQSTTENICS
jgi:CBS domain-containing protein